MIPRPSINSSSASPYLPCAWFNDGRYFARVCAAARCCCALLAFRHGRYFARVCAAARCCCALIADCDVATAGGQADSAMGRGKGAESGRVQAGNTAPWARSSLLRGTHPTAGAAQETQPAVGPHTVQFCLFASSKRPHMLRARATGSGESDIRRRQPVCQKGNGPETWLHHRSKPPLQSQSIKVSSEPTTM